MIDRKKVEESSNIDIDRLQKYTHVPMNFGDWCYYLLKYVSDFFENELILDLGTNYGHSSLVLASNNKNHVETYDVVRDLTGDELTRIRKDFNITFNILNVENIPLEKYKEAKVIYLDTIHNGVHERKVFDIISRSGFEGILICDDINFNHEMDMFWKSIDVCKMEMEGFRGTHGIGIVFFDMKYKEHFNGDVRVNEEKVPISECGKSLEIFKTLQDDISVMFDVGARTDIDYFEIKPDCEYHLFEPNIDFVNYLKEKISKFSSHNIKINGFGLSNVAESGCIYYPNTQSFEVHPHYPNMSVDKGLRFDLSTLDEYVDNNKIERIDFLKIDAEGFDLRVLEGGVKTLNDDKIKYIQFELWLEPIEFYNLLKNQYDMYFILEDPVIKHMPKPLDILFGLNFTTRFDEKTISEIIANLFTRMMGGNVFCVNKNI